MRLVLALGLSPLILAATPAAAGTCPWLPAWGSSQMVPDASNSLPGGTLADATLRQVVRSSIGGTRVRVRFSNSFGRKPLRIDAATIARSADNRSARIDIATVRPLAFSGAAVVTIPPGGEWLSDPVTLPVAAFDDLAVTLHLPEQPDVQTSHPGSRATSYVVKGDQVRAGDLAGATPTDHWFLLSGLEVESCTAKGAIVALGDSITDGRGSTTNGNDRWTDLLARRLGGKVAVINQGIGGNRVLLDGLGPNGMARLDRDVLALPGVRHLLLLEGINDIGGLAREAPATDEQHRALVTQLTGAYAQIVARARARGIKVHGATLLPFRSNDYYHPDDATEADRQAINAWIRTLGHFDSVIDFDLAMRDPVRPDHLNPAYDTGDGLHPNPAGFKAMADAVNLATFR